MIPPPRDTYKALLWDYDYLVAKSDDECCYSLSDREVQLLLAIVDYIGWPTRYKPTETEIDRDLIEEWSANLARKLMSGCCPDDTKIYRVTIDGVVQSSEDGGVTWEDDPGADPREHVPGTPVTYTGTVSEIRCALANSGVGAMQNAIDQIVTRKETAAGISAIMDTIIAIIITFGVLTGGLGILVALLMAVATLIFLADAETFEAAFTEEVWQDLLCAIYCNIQSNGTWKPGGFENVLESVTTDHPGLPGDTLKGIINGMGETAFLNACKAGFDAGLECDECECPMGCIDEGWIVSGTLEEIGEDYIIIRAADNGGFGIATISYGGTVGGVNFCCYLCSIEDLDTPTTTTAWIDCDGTVHFSGDGTHGDIRRTDRNYGGATLRAKLTFNVDDNCT